MTAAAYITFVTAIKTFDHYHPTEKDVDIWEKLSKHSTDLLLTTHWYKHFRKTSTLRTTLLE